MNGSVILRCERSEPLARSHRGMTIIVFHFSNSRLRSRERYRPKACFLPFRFPLTERGRGRRSGAVSGISPETRLLVAERLPGTRAGRFCPRDRNFRGSGGTLVSGPYPGVLPRSPVPVQPLKAAEDALGRAGLLEYSPFPIQ